MSSIIKKKIPEFIRQDTNKCRFTSKWRRSRGLHSKMRLHRKGHGESPDIGYRSPRELRYKNKKKGFAV